MTELFPLLSAPPVLRIVVQYLIALCSRPEAAIDVISGLFVRPILPDKNLKLGDPRLNLSREILPKPSDAAFSIAFFVITSDRK